MIQSRELYIGRLIGILGIGTMNSNEDQIWTELVNTLWAEVEALTSGTVANRLALGQRFHELRSKYSDRNFGGHRLTSGHGSFEEEIRKRGYRKMVKGLISALNQLG